ncbi:hypothetical protein Nepgr_012232 [Nepenthes gracilis]|uniref:Uncharacterized protein n=1 Tax=Nepenthes gracilis TaxID=150966 RepID=A0AAD3SH59_NEPGR|nr:hypothetical protein Nepgr_012232 [Nepenthes gracilis]
MQRGGIRGCSAICCSPGQGNEAEDADWPVLGASCENLAVDGERTNWKGSFKFSLLLINR